MVDEPKCPTGQQCEDHERVYETESKVGHAVWYPQMGGYVGKAVAVFDKQWYYDGETGVARGGCVDVYVWHDGEFPFDDGPPAVLHYCDPAQFIEFGETLVRINQQGVVFDG